MEQAYYFISSFATLDECKQLAAAIGERRGLLLHPTKQDLGRIQAQIDLGRNNHWSVVAWQRAVVEPINNRFANDFPNLLKEFVPSYQQMTDIQIVRAFEQAYKRTTGHLLAEKEKELHGEVNSGVHFLFSRSTLLLMRMNTLMASRTISQCPKPHLTSITGYSSS